MAVDFVKFWPNVWLVLAPIKVDLVEVPTFAPEL
jgi:hypothetical protein